MGAAQQRNEREPAFERDALVRAGHAVLARSGGAALTVAEVLAEAGLSTRAFYRHFPSKDDLVLAVFQTESERSLDRLHVAVDGAPDTRAAFEAWVDQVLALGFETRRARRTRPLWREGRVLRSQFPAAFDGIVEGVLAPLVGVLARGRQDGTFPLADPDTDARSIHAVAWAFVEHRLDGRRVVSLQAARAHVLRFCLPALGARP